MTSMPHAALFHYPMSCSSVARIVAAECGVSLDLIEVDIDSKATPEGNLRQTNPLGQVPTLRLPDGAILTQNVAVLAWLQDHGGSPYARRPGTADHYALLAALALCTSELHRGLVWPLIRSDVDADGKRAAKTLAAKRLAVIDEQVGGQTGLLASGPSAADAYLTWCLGLLFFAGIDLRPFPNLGSIAALSRERPASAAILAEDGAAVASRRSSLVAKPGRAK